MKHYQISKYSEQESDTWSAVTDIGNIYYGQKLSQKEYLRVEDLYIEFIERFLSSNTLMYKVKFLMDLRGEDGADKYFFDLDCCDIKIRGGEYLNTESILVISRLCLRDLMGVRLETDCGSYITFGSDLYLRIGTSNDHKGSLDYFDYFVKKGLFTHQVDHDPDE
ncbi:hypothetical protein [Vibrio sagamiensis]|uniref:Uncharacterized protein n=1 Tax=Vibrio sagamiensis NBRC 104589 TaxID=1219064 RepID=A0A511QJP4_9VIBR|nr:hypothetical protein [Vibrio sagamiensis]PNQ60470.1 hypothetical protein C1141_11780 [Vibrio agarivorans]GEM77544.1 hypothetical protein VSA01S_36560 [Vibrio sagamiensis NBRC 104589]